jgi:hypothetical protein
MASQSRSTQLRSEAIPRYQLTAGVWRPCWDWHGGFYLPASIVASLHTTQVVGYIVYEYFTLGKTFSPLGS